jgi:subtilisin family serine protease
MRTVLRALLALSLLVPVVLVAAPAAEAAPDDRPTFIVTLKSGEPRAVEHARRHGAEIEFVYEHALRGYAAKVSEGQIGALARDGRVARVERDGPVQVLETQSNATWGLDRIDDRAGLDGSYDYDATGAGVKAYIIDTGIRETHSDLRDRVVLGYDAFGGDARDCNGHGTHVAGTVGGTAHGVAKGVQLVAVRVLDCNGSGTWSGVAAGVDWVAGHANGSPAVANMSLGGGASSTVDDAVKRSIGMGITYAVAAGNGDRLGRAQDACNYSPARVPEAITIGATTQSDTKTSWSNYGTCVDWFAPGYQITSAWHTGDTATNTISGTSMATPHVAGAAALYLQNNSGATPAAVREALYAASTKSVVTESKTENNHLLYTSPPLTTGDTPTNVAPTASFTYECIDLACSFDGAGSADDDGSITSYSWTFGDGSTATGDLAQKTYAAAGTYTVTLTVMDNSGATDTSSESVQVSTSTSTSITLSANGHKVKGTQHADLSWSGATSTSVDVFRDGAKITTTANDGFHTDNIGRKGGGSYTYKVCQAGSTTTCSFEVTVTF